MTQPDPPKPLTVRCPACQRSTRFSPDNPWRPFCSQRCRSLDLGAWAGERYRVAASPPADEDSDPLQ